MIPKRLVEKIGRLCVPLSASFELTRRCNLECIHCYQLRPEGKELTTAKVLNILDQLQDAGCLFLSLTGGEAMVRSDFWKILKYARKKSFAVTLQTNGTLITPEAARRIHDLGVFSVHVSLLGASPESFDPVTGIKGSFHRVMKAVRSLTANKTPVVLKVTVIKQNLAELGLIRRLARRMGAAAIFSPIVYPKSDGTRSPVKLRLDDDELKQFYRWLFREFPGQAGPFRKKRLHPICQYGATDCCITPYGKVYPCVTVPIPVGDLTIQKFRDIWTGSEMLKKIRCSKIEELVECSTCKLSASCMRCSGLSFLEDRNIDGASRECCRMTRTIMEVLGNEEEVHKA